MADYSDCSLELPHNGVWNVVQKCGCGVSEIQEDMNLAEQVTLHKTSQSWTIKLYNY